MKNLETVCVRELTVHFAWVRHRKAVKAGLLSQSQQVLLEGDCLWLIDRWGRC